MDKRTILYSEMTPGAEWEGRFNQWYDTDHIPARLIQPGFRGAERYNVEDSQRYLVVYDLESAAALQTEGYQKVKNEPNDETKWMLSNVSGFTRYIADQISEQKREGILKAAETPYIFSVFFQVPIDREQEFNDWYTQDHVPILLKHKDWLMCRRFKIINGEPEAWTHIALHYLNDASVLNAPEREEARNTEWRARLAREEWFKGNYQLFKKYKSGRG